MTDIKQAASQLDKIQYEMGRVVVGQQDLIRKLILALLCNHHVLIEGLPGLAKTLTVTCLARAFSASFHRIQFTPDLLPADVVGTMIYQPRTGDFTTRKGPIFANVVLADEINRAPAKVQSALLEAMQERQVTIGDDTFQLPDPFLVLATQNPVDQEGTYPLPEAQIDRFMFKLIVSYPSRQDELLILRRMAQVHPASDITPVLSPDELRQLRLLLDDVLIEDKVQEYIVDLVAATRDPAACGLDDLKPLIRFGASPRATIMLALAARANALMQQRNYTTPNDVKAVAMDILRHRVAVTYEAEAEDIAPDHIVQKILDSVRVP
ncbi:MAG: AAA family ATPase [Oligosphaeraceae bacterium]